MMEILSAKSPMRWRGVLSGGMHAWAMLFFIMTPMGAAVAEEGSQPWIPKLDVADDPRWLRQLPSVVLPLPKPSDLSTNARPAVERLATSAGKDDAHPETSEKIAIKVADVLPDNVAANPTLPAVPELLASGDGMAGDVTQRLADITVIEPTAREQEAREGANANDETSADTKIRMPLAETRTHDIESDLTEHGATEALASKEAADKRGMADTRAVLDPESAHTTTLPVESNAAMQSSDTPPTPSRDRWQIQLLAGRSLDKVKEDRRLFERRYAVMLEGLAIKITQSEFGDERDAFYRLRVLDWTSEQDAVRWCARLRAIGSQCLVVRVTNDSGH
ncbi:hypothetical protein CCR95_21165 [Thiocystis minor]|uniref:SPOR domain-containing protein n=1 Tax=Thiocystis minor TaxID=61597 RepID=UPI001914D639|nr:SPOR domain-containing protein [Thiocystis minor]MBK5966515.1 hypothetical protein [Thiocystis minor]